MIGSKKRVHQGPDGSDDLVFGDQIAGQEAFPIRGWRLSVTRFPVGRVIDEVKAMGGISQGPIDIENNMNGLNSLVLGRQLALETTHA